MSIPDSKPWMIKQGITSKKWKSASKLAQGILDPVGAIVKKTMRFQFQGGCMWMWSMHPISDNGFWEHLDDYNLQKDTKNEFWPRYILGLQMLWWKSRVGIYIYNQQFQGFLLYPIHKLHDICHCLRIVWRDNSQDTLFFFRGKRHLK